MAMHFRKRMLQEYQHEEVPNPVVDHINPIELSLSSISLDPPIGNATSEDSLGISSKNQENNEVALPVFTITPDFDSYRKNLIDRIDKDIQKMKADFEAGSNKVKQNNPQTGDSSLSPPTDGDCRTPLFNQLGVDLSPMKSKMKLEWNTLLKLQCEIPDEEDPMQKELKPPEKDDPMNSESMRSLVHRIGAVFAATNYADLRIKQLEGPQVKFIKKFPPKSLVVPLRSAIADAAKPNDNEKSKPSKDSIDAMIEEYPLPSPDDSNKLIIGPNGTTILKSDYMSIDWTRSIGTVTKKLLVLIFNRDTLAVRSLTGRPSPAFLEFNKPEKQPLDKDKVDDIAFFMKLKKGARLKEVRTAITVKCADEFKLRKIRMARQMKTTNKENDPCASKI